MSWRLVSLLFRSPGRQFDQGDQFDRVLQVPWRSLRTFCYTVQVYQAPPFSYERGGRICLLVEIVEGSWGKYPKTTAPLCRVSHVIYCSVGVERVSKGSRRITPSRGFPATGPRGGSSDLARTGGVFTPTMMHNDRVVTILNIAMYIELLHLAPTTVP